MNIAVIVTSLLTMLPAMNHSQPDDVVSIDNDQVETTDNVSSTLLTKARHLKTTIKPGYGEFYRRSAWASLDENQPATALSTLEELSQSYETLFDQWDSYRIAGRIYSSMENHEQAAAKLSLAEDIATATPSLVSSHPRVFTEIMQQQSAAFAMVGSHASAAECAERLRDHSNSRIASDHKLLAAQTACIYWLAEANKDKYIDAWDRQIELFPSSVAGNQGIWIQLEHASNLASLGESLTETLESLFANSNLEEHSNYIEIGKSLTDAWLSSTEDPQIASDHAFSVMTQTWNTVLAKHDDWLSLVNDDAPKQAAINRQVKTFLQWYAAMSYERGDLTTLESLGASYGEKFGYEDGEAENMLRLSANP